jgi:hypothetical protein
MYRNPLFKNYNICGGGSAVCCGRQVQEAVLFSRPGHGVATTTAAATKIDGSVAATVA